MSLVIGPLDGLRLKIHVGHGLGLEHDMGLGIAQAISLVGITSLTLEWSTNVILISEVSGLGRYVLSVVCY